LHAIAVEIAFYLKIARIIKLGVLHYVLFKGGAWSADKYIDSISVPLVV